MQGSGDSCTNGEEQAYLSSVANLQHHALPVSQLGEANSQREEMVGLLGGYQRSIQELQVRL